ncbi:MAG: hypothetical protein R3270_10790 [Gammaproteobacteria bacterium]|nr:hypothetical protein [Gammaproteobacteria bacterium]
MLALTLLAGAGIPADPIIDRTQPLLSDFDISGTEISVEVTQGPGYYEYVYTFAAPETNIAKAVSFWLDTSCAEQLEDHEVAGLFPNHSGANFVSEFESVPYMPVLGLLPNGKQKLMDVSVSGHLPRWVMAEPGDTKTVRFRSTGAPVPRHYGLSSDVKYYERIDWPESGHIPGLPSEFDFEIKGVIAGPGCEINPPAQAAEPRFRGANLRTEFASAQDVLTYSQPLRNRLHVKEGQEYVAFRVNYAATLDPATFETCPAEAARYFNPVPGGSETVRIPLSQARNFLTLAARAAGEPPLQPKHDRVSHSPIDVDVFEFRRTDVEYEPREIACKIHTQVPDELVRRPPPPPPEYAGKPMLRLMGRPTGPIPVHPGGRGIVHVMLDEVADAATLKAMFGDRDITAAFKAVGGSVNVLELPEGESGRHTLRISVSARDDVVGAPEEPEVIEREVVYKGLQMQIQGRAVKIDADGNRTEMKTRTITVEMDPATGKPVDDDDSDNRN